MKNVTVSADERLIEKAREKARKERTSLNALFREWLASYIGLRRPGVDYGELMDRLSYVRPGKTFTRDELNER